MFKDVHGSHHKSAPQYNKLDLSQDAVNVPPLEAGRRTPNLYDLQ